MVALLALGGCATLDYYAQSVGGHLALMSRRVPVERVIRDPSTPASLRNRLSLALEVREFAHRELDLPNNQSYRSYVDLVRPFVSWTVVAAPELSLAPKTWCFPVVGCVAYRGYFDEAAAWRFAGSLQEQGYDVHVAGVRAYSTLGWFDDPLLNTMVAQPDHRLAGVIFHELAHQRLYVPGDSAFNEAYAMVIEREGIRRWLAAAGDPEALRRYREDAERREQFLALVRDTRKSLEAIYAAELDDDEKRRRKFRAFERMRADYRALRAGWNGYSGYDAWFDSGLNNAKLALVATYNAWVPALERLLGREGADLRAFNAACEKLAGMDKQARTAALEKLGG
ncbi:MAG: aminopeptidase [Gammaproteobacteria bacterium]|nr:aminopeptidase [Gammaproteobacteria bacterium]